MKSQQKKFPGKILLFGEYSVLQGSFAALIPYNRVNGQFSTGNKINNSNSTLLSFLEYLRRDGHHTNSIIFDDYIDTEHLNNDIQKGLFFNSTIPQNKGLGSSGAICAAIYDCYKRKALNELSDLRKLFSHMESWFHGNSSGIDPLCIYLNRPLILRNEEYILVNDDVHLNRNFVKPFLVDTGTESKTEPLVHHFRELMEQKNYATGFGGIYIPLVNEAVNQWKDGELSHRIVADLSMAQQKYLTRMIPDEYKKVWESGLDNDLYAMKLCGSGGGGMILGFTNKMIETGIYLKKQFDINIITV